MNERKKEYRVGMTAAISCAVLWGFLPIYWKALVPIDSMVIILYRIMMVGFVCFLAALKLYGWKEMWSPWKQKGVAARFFFAGILITCNWSLYIWAVNANHVIQTCIGYYIEPLMVCMFGVILFKEKLTKYKLVALVMAATGIAIILWHFKQIPYIALCLAVTFAVYAALKKSYKIPPILSLLYETILLVPFAVVAVIYVEVTGKGALSVAEPYQYGLLLLCGVATAVPLGLFASAANKISLVSLGITEYLSPSITLIIGIFMFKEPFDAVQFIAFAVIWIGLVFFTVGEMRESNEKNWEIEEGQNEGA